MTIEVWVDVLCPWCYIAERRIIAALAGDDQRLHEIRWRSWQLDPSLSSTPHETAADQMRRPDWWGDGADERIERIRTLGRIEGVELDFERARPVNTFDAHRLLQFAQSAGRGGEALRELLLAYHTYGHNIADRDTLVDIGVRAGLAATAVATALRNDWFAGAVADDQQRGRHLGVTGVPSLLAPGQPIQSAVRLVDELRRLLGGATQTPTRDWHEAETR